MKITQQRLRRLIKEQITKRLSEDDAIELDSLQPQVDAIYDMITKEVEKIPIEAQGVIWSAVISKIAQEANSEEQEPAMQEVSSEKQRRWACAQKDKPASERADGLSAAEAEEMCTSKVKEAELRK